jgi:hypothetical protein
MSMMPFLATEVSEEEIRQKGDNGGFFSWNYECPESQETSTGYDDVDFDKYSKAWYNSFAPEDRDKALDEIADIYLDRGIYPTLYYSEFGTYNELNRVFDNTVGFNGNYVKNNSIGRMWENWRFPNIHRVMVQQQGADRGSMYDKFFIRKWLKQAIRFIIDNGKEGSSPIPTRVYSALRLVGGSASNFKNTDAQAIYERYCPENGLILDTSMGFGGRLLGAMSSQKNFYYIGTDPNTETCYHLHELRDDLNNFMGVDYDRMEIHCVGSEYIEGIDGQVDFSFTSPPYFNCEVYSTEESQSYNKYSELDGWVENFVRPTIRNIRKSLKKGGLCAINIADFYTKDTGKINFVDKWIEISEEEGLPWDSDFYLGISARAGTASQKAGDSTKKERVPVFRKR